MYTPDFVITNKILNDISLAEYARSSIENSTILPVWKQQLITDMRAEKIYFSLKPYYSRLKKEHVKGLVNEFDETSSQLIKNLNELLLLTDEISIKKDLDENLIKDLHLILTKNTKYTGTAGKFRYTENRKKLPTEKILAEVTRIFDWYNSAEVKNTHPVVVAAILRANLEYIAPFESLNSVFLDVINDLVLKSGDFEIIEMLCIQKVFYETTPEYITTTDSYIFDDNLTLWIEYFTKGFRKQILEASEKVKLLEKNTKVARATGRYKLTDRQERIVTYLQDYGILRNKDFPRVFPDISEDTVLRDLKELIDQKIVVKKGKTKSSRYELE